MTPAMDDRARDVFAALAERLIPGDGSQPSAAAVGLAGRWLDLVLETRPDLSAGLLETLAEAGTARPEIALGRLATERPERYEELLLITAAGYLMSPRVRKRLGYPGQRPAPILSDEADYYLGGDLLEPVQARGPIYRRPPPEPVEGQSR